MIYTTKDVEQVYTNCHYLHGIQYQELFAVCQAISGPGSTKMHYCINLIHSNFIAAFVAFLIWRLVCYPPSLFERCVLRLLTLYCL